MTVDAALIANATVKRNLAIGVTVVSGIAVLVASASIAFDWSLVKDHVGGLGLMITASVGAAAFILGIYFIHKYDTEKTSHEFELDSGEDVEHFNAVPNFWKTPAGNSIHEDLDPTQEYQ